MTFNHDLSMKDNIQDDIQVEGTWRGSSRLGSGHVQVILLSLTLKLDDLFLFAFIL